MLSAKFASCTCSFVSCFISFNRRWASSILVEPALYNYCYMLSTMAILLPNQQVIVYTALSLAFVRVGNNHVSGVFCGKFNCQTLIKDRGTDCEVQTTRCLSAPSLSSSLSLDWSRMSRWPPSSPQWQLPRLLKLTMFSTLSMAFDRLCSSFFGRLLLFLYKGLLVILEKRTTLCQCASDVKTTYAYHL